MFKSQFTGLALRDALLRSAPQGEGLRWCVLIRSTRFRIRLSNSPRLLRSPHEHSDMRELTRGVPSRMSLSLIRATNPDTHHRPSFISGSGFAGLLCSFFPGGACGTTGRFTAPAAPCASTWLPCAFAHGNDNSLGRRSSPAFRTRMDFAACCITDRELSLAPTPPGPRELSRGHALGPSARRVGVNLLSDNGSRL